MGVVGQTLSGVAAAEQLVSRRRWDEMCVHFVGIGGTGMRGAARMLRQWGCRVSGSDLNDSSLLDELRARGVVVYIGHDAAQLPAAADLMVATAAAPATNPEVQAARRRNLPVVKYAELLGLLMRGSDGIAVGGTHGKTTTTAMTSVVLRQAGLDPSFVIGGEVPQLGGSAHAGQGRLFVAEACEYDRSFWNLHPTYAIVTNVDCDHLDCYRDLADIIDAFRGFVARLPATGRLVVNGEDANLGRAIVDAPCPVRTFGIGDGVDWRIRSIRRTGGSTEFMLEHQGAARGPFHVRFPGLHYVLNATAVIALCHELGLDMDTVARGLSLYAGAGRRFQTLGTVDDVVVIDDYGHHPCEVRMTLEAARQEFRGRRIWCVFQPHQHSRTRLLLDDFASAFKAVDRVMVPDIYSVRDSEFDRASVSSADLVARARAAGTEAEYVPTFAGVVERLAADVRPGDVVVTMGAGPVDQVGWGLLNRLNRLPSEGGRLARTSSSAA